jgi:[ribosomal protein S5]-alanine N-acetyltransferase
MYFLQSPRLGFRHWDRSDLPLAQRLWGSAEVTRLIGGPFNNQQVQVRLAREIESQRNFNIQYWPIFLLTSGAHVGCCGLRPYNLEQNIPELGFHLHPEFWGQGFAEEAARTVIDYASRVLKTNGLFAGHHPDNTGSKHLLEKLGFTPTGSQHYPPTGLDHPTYLRKP